MKTVITSYSHKLTNLKTITTERTCNCIDKAKFTLSQNYVIINKIFKAVLIPTNPDYKINSSSAQLNLHCSCDTQTTIDN